MTTLPILPCIHRGRQCGTQLVPGGPSIPCFVCEHPAHRTTTLAVCEACPDRQPVPHVLPAAPSTSAEPTFFRMVQGQQQPQPIDLTNLYAGATAFLVLGGPSARQEPLERLAERGCLIGSYNNNPAMLPANVRPHVWLHTDKVCKFHDSLWRDPAVLKFSPLREWQATGRRGRVYKNVRRRTSAGFEPTGQLACHMPNVIGYTRNSLFRPDHWLTEPTINRGNCKRSATRNLFPHVINTMFSAVRLLYTLGCRTIYLVGCDFRMVPDQPYGFSQAKSSGGIAANNENFRKMDSMFTLLAPRLAAAGCYVYNTTPRSGLTAFAHKPFNAAVDSVSSQFEQVLNARGWYDD